MLHKDNSIERFERLPLEESNSIDDVRVLEYNDMNMIMMNDFRSYTESHDTTDTITRLTMDTESKDISLMGFFITDDSLYFDDNMYDYATWLSEIYNIPIYVLSDNIEENRLDTLIEEAIETNDIDKLDVFIEETDEDIKNDLKKHLNDQRQINKGTDNLKNAVVEGGKRALKKKKAEYWEQFKKSAKKNWKKNTAIAAFGAYGAHKVYGKINQIHKKYDPQGGGIIQKRIDILKRKLGILKQSPTAQKNPGIIRRIMNKIRELIARLRGKQQS